jgi:hypothetical protein
MSLIDQTRALLEARRQAGFSLRRIALDDGEPNYEWLKKFSVGKIPNPGVTRVQALHDRLLELAGSNPDQ